MFSLGVAVQAFEARQTAAASPTRFLLALARQRAWIAGTLLTIAAWLLQGIALLFAPLSLVQPALAAQVVWLALVSGRVLGERLSGSRLWATGGIALGLAGTAWAAPEHTAHHSGGATLIVPIVTLGLLTLVPQFRRGFGSIWSFIAALCAGFAYAWTGLATKLAADDLTNHSWAGCVGWFTAVAAVAVIGTGNEMAALRVRPATQVVPIVLALEVLIPVLLATSVAGEHWSVTRGGGALLAVSIALVVVGGVVVAASTPRADQIGATIGTGSRRGRSEA